jgi:small subunit ribosomal protein S21
VIRVSIRHGEPTERFLQRFKRICAKEGVFKEIKRRSHYEKPSDKRRRREKEAKRALRKRARIAARKKR